MKYQFNDIQFHALLKWYRKNKRDLPWRDTNNPYDVLLSEIMLQQTRVEFVKERFILFKKDIPDIKDLSKIPEDSLMKYWEGMGYYNRARNLKRCAQVIVKDYQGKIPSTYEELLSLPGIGPYTAGAISSIAYGNPVPAVDGNVLRVFTRIFGIQKDIKDPKTKKLIEEILLTYYQSHPHLSKKSIQDFTQAIMELGALTCVPNGIPHCIECPFQDSCITNQKGLHHRIPARKKLEKRKDVFLTILVIRDNKKFLFHKRPNHGLLAGLYELPNLTGHLSKQEVISLLEKNHIYPVRIKTLENSKHLFTHITWHMIAYEIQVEEISFPLDHSHFLATKKELQDLAIPSAFQFYLKQYL